MATVIGKRVRGRKKGELRTLMASVAATVKKVAGEHDVTVHIADAATPKGKPETVTLTIPKGSVVVPFALTADKSDANSREQIHSGMEDAGVEEFSVESQLIRTDAGIEKPVFYVTKK